VTRPIAHLRPGVGPVPSALYCPVCPLPPGTRNVWRVEGRPERCESCGSEIVNHADPDVSISHTPAPPAGAEER
jgi:hypothetical protein